MHIQKHTYLFLSADKLFKKPSTHLAELYDMIHTHTHTFSHTYTLLHIALSPKILHSIAYFVLVHILMTSSIMDMDPFCGRTG